MPRGVGPMRDRWAHSAEATARVAARASSPGSLKHAPSGPLWASTLQPADSDVRTVMPERCGSRFNRHTTALPIRLENQMKRVGLIMVAAVAGLAACSSGDSSPQSATPSTTSESPSSSPRGVETQMAEPFRLPTHCGISTTEYAGRWWAPVSPPPVPQFRPDPTGTVTRDFSTDGTMTLVNDNLLRFVVTDPRVEEVGLTVEFVPAAVPPPLCE